MEGERSMKSNARRKLGMLAGVLALLLVLSACSDTGGKSTSVFGGLDRDEAGTLKVAYFNEQAFYLQYGNAFQAMYPNMTIEVVSLEQVFQAEDPVSEMEKMLGEQQPDVLHLTEDQYAALAEKGLLYDLDAAIKQDEFDLDSFYPAVVELLKARGGGKLYGLSPSFSSQALYFNKGMFDQYNIPYPRDGMSWEEVLQLAARFPAQKDGDNATHGLAQSSQANDLFALIRMIGEAKGLSYADADAGQVTIDSHEWKEIFQMVIDGYQSGSISMPSDAPGGERLMLGILAPGGGRTIGFGPDSMKFMTGQAAMMIDGSMLMEMLRVNVNRGEAVRVQSNAADSGANAGPRPRQLDSIDWDLVTVPVDPSQPDVMSGIGVDSIFAISASSDNPAAAWELLKYINGEQLAKTSARSSSAMSARTAHKKVVEGKNVDAFYKLGINEQLLLQSLPAGFADSFAQLASGEIKRVVDGGATLDEAIAQIASQGQQLLTDALLESDAS